MGALELAGVRAKIDRAEYHLKNIDDSLKLLISNDPDAKRPVIFERESDGKVLIVKLAECQPIEPTLPLLVGDCVHNLRAALDHLVYQLAIKNRASSKSAEKTFFPIYLTKTTFDKRVKESVKPFVSDMALAEIEKCQPYTAYDVPSEADIWILSQLDIIDKHRLLVVASQKFSPTEFTLTFADGQVVHEVIPNPQWKAVKDNAEIIRFEIATPPGKVCVQINTVTAIQIVDTGLACDGVFLQDALRQCIGIVSPIVSDFGKYFFGE